MVQGTDCGYAGVGTFASALLTHTRVALDVVGAHHRSVKEVNIRAVMAENYCQIFAKHARGSSRRYSGYLGVVSESGALFCSARDLVPMVQYDAVN